MSADRVFTKAAIRNAIIERPLPQYDLDLLARMKVGWSSLARMCVAKDWRGFITTSPAQFYLCDWLLPCAISECSRAVLEWV
jgi:hypothetical protein